MLNLSTVHTIKIAVAMFATYFPTVAFSGCFAAWVAKKIGDDTAEREGMITLNPMVHARFFGLVTLILALVAQFPFIFGFGSMVPVHEHNIKEPFKKFKFLTALLSRSVANVFMVCFAILVWVLFFKLAIQPYDLGNSYPALVDSVTLLYLAFRQLNMISAVLYFVFGLVKFIMSYVFPDLKEESMFVIFVVEIYLLLLLWYFVAPYLNNIIVLVESLFGYLIGSFIG